MPSNLSASRKSVVPLLWSFAFLSYLLRMNITVAQQYMAKELSLSDVQIGSIFSAFLIGYSLFQIPGGVLGDKFGPRLVLGAAGLSWVVTTILTGLLPGRLFSTPAVVVVVLIALRFLHGIGQGPTYPVAMTAVSDWFPDRQHALITALIFTGSTVGSAFASPLVAHIMNALGWRATFYLTGSLPLIVSLLWFWRTKALPRTKPATRVDKQGDWWRIF